MTLITAEDWVSFIALCGLMGVTGQLVRAIGGAKKVNDQARTLDARFGDVFDVSTFLTSLSTGFAAGVVAGLGLKPNAISSDFLLGVLAAGYTGADFIEAFLKKSLPDIKDAAKVAETKPVPSANLLAATLQLGTSVSDGVRTVIANFKHVDLADVTRDKKLSDPSLSFDKTDCLALEQEINLYFFNVLRLQFDRLLEGPDDIKPEFSVAQVVAKVTSLHPRPRA